MGSRSGTDMHGMYITDRLQDPGSKHSEILRRAFQFAVIHVRCILININRNCESVRRRSSVESVAHVRVRACTCVYDVLAVPVHAPVARQTSVGIASSVLVDW